MMTVMLGVEDCQYGIIPVNTRPAKKDSPVSNTISP